jgi:hypothetical protein
MSMKTNRRDFMDEFNTNIQFIESVQTKVDTHNRTFPINLQDKLDLQTLVRKAMVKLRSMLNNDYFHFMFINNCIIKEFCLKFLQYIIQKPETDNSEDKFESLKTLCELMEWDFDLEKNQFRNPAAKQIYGQYFSLIIPQLSESLYTINKRTSILQNSLTPPTTPAIKINSIFSKDTDLIKNDKLFNLNQLVCSLFSAVPFEYLIHVKFLPDTLDLLFDQLLSPLLYAQLMYAISNNICGYTHSKDPGLSNFQICEQLRINIHEKCAHQTLIQMERNVRVDASRNLLKKTLNNYCQYITDHKRDLESLVCNSITNSQKDDPKFDLDMLSEEDRLILVHIGVWQESLYRIVINIVKTLRLEFERNNRSVEIDLVIYFYELLLANIDNLTSEDAINIATKLMPVIIKINAWRHEEMGKKFTVERGQCLYKLSFKLSDKFMLILGEKFVEIEWVNFEKIWINGIKDWYPMSYKLISTYCANNKEPGRFGLVKKLANIILDSWDENRISKVYSICDCDCSNQKKKKYNTFLSEESMNAMLDLVNFYDHMIQLDEKYFKCFMLDIMPLLEIIRNLFNIIKSQAKLIMFFEFYQKLFQMQHPSLKAASLWKNHFISLMLRLERICESSDEIEVDEQVSMSILNCLNSVSKYFDRNYLVNYLATINDTLTFINLNSPNIATNEPIYTELTDYFRNSNV